MSPRSKPGCLSSPSRSARRAGVICIGSVSKETPIQSTPSLHAVAPHLLLVDPNVGVLQELPDHAGVTIVACNMQTGHAVRTARLVDVDAWVTEQLCDDFGPIVETGLVQSSAALIVLNLTLTSTAGCCSSSRTMAV